LPHFSAANIADNFCYTNKYRHTCALPWQDQLVQQTPELLSAAKGDLLAAC
jgi:hypothetical protein